MNVSVSVVDGKTVTSVHELVRNAAGKPVRIKAIEGGKYLLAEGEQGFAPENITLKRVGKNLHVALEGTDPDQPELIIEDFYEHEGQLVGMAEDSSYHEYVAVDGDDDSAVAFLIDGATSAQALGAAELVGFGDGLAMLAGSVIPTAALGLGALGIIGAGLAIGGKDGGSNSGGSNGGGTQVAPPPAQPEIGQITDNVGDKQGVIQPGTSTDDNTPTISGTGEPGSTIEILDNGKVIGGAIVDGNGNWTFTPEQPLPDGGHVISVRPEGGNESGGVEIDIDTKAPGRVLIDGVTDDVGPKTGLVAHQGMTDDNTPTLSGRAEAGSLVSIYDGVQLLGTAVADAQGNWSFTPAALADGEHRFTATATDAAGNIGLPSEGYVVTIKTDGPLKPEIGAITDNEGPVVGELDNPAVTDDRTPTLSGSGEPGNTVTIIDNNVVIGEVIVGENGKWEFTPEPLEEGDHSFEVVETDANGNRSEPSEPWPVVIDTTAPGKPGLGGDGHGLGEILDDVGDAQGPIEQGGVTDDTRPTLVGTGEPGDTVSILDKGQVIGSAVVGEDGKWEFTPEKDLEEGQHDFSVIFTDPAGNSSEESDVWPIIIDVTAPEQPSIGEVLDDVGDSKGPIGSGAVTDDAKPTLNGSGEPGSTIAIIDNDKQIGEALVDENGRWTFTPETDLEDGEHSFTVTSTDPAGNVSEPSEPHVVIVDTQAPEQPSIGEVLDDIGDSKGLIGSGAVTDDARPTLNGSGEPGSTIAIIDNDKQIGEALVDENGQWTFTPETDLEDGEHSFTVTSTDPAGNVSEPSEPHVVIIDTVAPNKPTIDSVYDDQGDKQGNLVAGETTDDAKPTISGKAEAGSTVVIKDNGVVIGQAEANEAGEWTFVPPTPLGNGGHDLSVEAIDAAGNVSEPSDHFDFNLIAGGKPAMPAITAVKDDVGSIQGNLQKNAITDDARPTIEGTAEAGATVSIYSNGKLLGTAVADASGVWSFTPESDLNDGLHNLTATAANLAGNVSPSTGIFPITVDTVAPEADNGAKLYDDVGQIVGEISSGDTTDDNLPTFNGKSEPNATVVIYDNDEKIGEAKTDAEGNWSFTPSKPLTDGEHSFTTEVIDQAGNVGEKSEAIDFIVDTRTVEISITQVRDDVGSKQSDLSKGDVTDDATPTLSGKATAGGLVKIYDNGDLIGDATADAQGNWSFTPPVALPDGLHNLTATVTTEAKGESEHTPIFDLTVDTTAPNQPSIDDVQDDVGVTQGSVGNGKHTDDTTPTLSGQGEPGSTVRIYDYDDLLGSAVVGEDGEWTFTPTTPLLDGEHSFTVTSEDKAGNLSEASEPYVVIVDTVAPTAPSIASVYDDQGDLKAFLNPGDVTDDSKPEVKGTAEANATVIIYNRGVEIDRVQADADGNWTFVPKMPLSVGDYDLSVKAVDAAGNISPESNHFDFSLMIGDKPAEPAITRVTDDVGPHTGALQKGGVTDDARPTIVGTAEPHATISVYSNDELLGTTVADKDGNWSFTPEEGKALAEGLNDLTVTATNAAGNVSVPTGKFPIVVDLTAPELGEVKLVDDFGQVTGHIVSGTVTDDNLPTYVGKIEGEAGGKVIVFDNDKPIGEAEIGPDGSWTFTPKEALEDGEHRFEFQVIDKAGNVGEKSEAIDFVVDTREVEVSIVRAEDNFGSKQGNLSSGDVTDDETPTLVGKATAGGLVTIHVGGQVLGTAVADKDGNWSFIVPEADKLGHGQHEFTATVTTEANGQSQHTQVFVLDIDLQAPNKPSIEQAYDDVHNQVGPVSNGGHTNDTTPTLSGQAEAYSTVYIYAEGIGLLDKVTAKADGTWEYTPTTELPNGEYSFTVKSEDKAGNLSEASEPYVVIVDTVAPGLGIAELQDDVGPNTANIVSGTITDDNRPTYVGKVEGEVGGKVIVFDNDKKIGEAEIGPDGSWTFTPEDALDEGNHRFEFQVIDQAGNAGPKSEAIDFIVSMGPATTVTINSMSKDSGFSQSDFVTNDGSAGRAISGTLAKELEAGEALEVSTDGGLTWMTAVVNGTHWVAQDMSSHGQSWSIQARVANEAGYGPVAEQIVTLDTSVATPTSISVAGKNVEVAFDAESVKVGEKVSVFVENKTYSHVLTEQDLLAGKVTIATESTIAQSKTIDFEPDDMSFGGVKFSGNYGGGVQWLPGYTPSGHSIWLGQGSGHNNSTWELPNLSRTVSIFIAAADYGGSVTFYNAEGIAIGNRSIAADGASVINPTTVSFTAPAGEVIAKFIVQTPSDLNGIIFDNLVMDPFIGASLIDEAGNISDCRTPNGAVVSVPDTQKVVAGSAVHVGDSDATLFEVADIGYFFGSDAGLHGNQGIDTVQLLGKGQTLDLSALAGKISSVEIFDITGSGKNTLKLSLVDVLENGAQNLFADDDNVQLVVKGDAGDRLELNDLLGTGGMDLGDWGEQGQLTSGGIVYNVYQHSGMAAEVLVQSGVDVNLNNHG